MHLLGDEQRAHGIVVVRNRRAEERKQGVAGVLVDVSLVAADDAAQLDDHRIDDLQQLLGIETIGERRETRDVREQRGDQPPLLGERAAGLDQSIRNRAGDEAAEGRGDVLVARGSLRGC